MNGGMHGKTCVVTGATSGIGEQIAIELARRGAHIGLVGRNPTKLEVTSRAIRAAEPEAQLDVFVADLSLLAEVRTLAGELHAAYERIDVLANNAGIHSLGARRTSEGLDEMMATNYFAPFLLTNLVRDLLEAGAPSRVVVTASEAHRHPGRLDLDSLAEPGDYTRYTSFLPYGRSKLYDLLFTQELARRLAGTGVTANCFCPGAVGTGLLAENKLIDAGGRVLSHTPIIRTPAQGAGMGIRLATDPGLESVSGEFFTSTPGLRFMRMAPSRRDFKFQRDLWERTAEIVGV